MHARISDKTVALIIKGAVMLFTKECNIDSGANADDSIRNTLSLSF